MQIIVCVREALDWNLSTKQFRIDPQSFAPVVAHPRYRIDQFDEIAMETALQTREVLGGAIRVVHALCVGMAQSEDTLKHALAMQADIATLVEVTADVDCAASLLAAAVMREQDADIVLCGRVSSDHGTGVTGPMLAELLGRPFVRNVIRIEGGHNDWRCTRETPAGHEVLHVAAPFVASVTNAPHNMPRVPTMKHVMQAHRKTIAVVDAAGLGINISSSVCLARRHVPVNLKGCRMLQGSAEEQARELATCLRATSLRPDAVGDATDGAA